MTRRVLCVDDEPHVLDGFRRHLRKQFELDTATSGAEALARLNTGDGYAVVVSDMRMPGMDGVTLLTQVKQLEPATVCIMLTGCADLSVAVEAVNTCNIFRFLAKPCPPEALARAIQDGLRQYELLHAEKELLEQTLRGAVQVLCEVLSLVNPPAFGCATRLRRLVRDLAHQLEREDAWQCEIAAMLSQVGCVAIPQSILEKADRGRPLSEQEQKTLQEHPALGRALLSHIPRLEAVAEIVGRQFEGPDQAPPGARLLRLAVDFDRLRQQGLKDLEALNRLRSAAHDYDPQALSALATILHLEDRYELKTVELRELQNHMLLAEDVSTKDGMLLVSKGQEVTLGMRERLANFAANRRLEGPLRVLVPVRREARD